jgi:hypothetical protein
LNMQVSIKDSVALLFPGGLAGSSNVAFATVELSEPSETNVEVTYTTSEIPSSSRFQAATSGIDFESIGSKTITFKPGETSKDIIIPIYRDMPTAVDDATMEIFARDVAYRNWAEGENIDNTLSGFYGKLDYKVDKVFQSTASFNTAGFYAVGLSSDEAFQVNLLSVTDATIKNPKGDEPETITITPTISDSEETVVIHDLSREPVLAIRGTDSIADLFSDLNLDGVGWNQYLTNRDDLKNWIADQVLQGNPAGTSITGHSLGAAIAQLIVADASSSVKFPLVPGKPTKEESRSAAAAALNRVVTFNPPGVTRRGWRNSLTGGSYTPLYSNARSTTHYVTSGDLVSLAGDEFLPGKVVLSSYPSSAIYGERPIGPISFTKQLASYAYDYVLERHTLPVLTPFIQRSQVSRPSITSTATDASVTVLNAPSFTYTDQHFKAFEKELKFIPALETSISNGITRESAESIRQTIAEFFRFLDTDPTSQPVPDAQAILPSSTLVSSINLDASTEDRGAISINLADGKAMINLNPPVIFNITGVKNATGTAFADALIGNNSSNILIGGGGNDLLNGGGGNDRLNGQAGNDKLIGGAGQDTFAFSMDGRFKRTEMGIDRIVDFQPRKDKIQLQKKLFGLRGRGTSFESVQTLAEAKASSNRITYLKPTGRLYYNQNGAKSGFGSGGLFADLKDNLFLSGSDLTII